MQLFDKILRAGEGRTLRRLKAVGDAVNSIEENFTDLTDDELRFAKARLVPDLVDLLPRLDARAPGDPPLFLVTRP